MLVCRAISAAWGCQEQAAQLLQAVSVFTLAGDAQPAAGRSTSFSVALPRLA